MTQHEKLLRYLYFKSRPVTVIEIVQDTLMQFDCPDLSYSIHHGVINVTGRTSELRLDHGIEVYDKATETYFFPPGRGLFEVLDQLHEKLPQDKPDPSEGQDHAEGGGSAELTVPCKTRRLPRMVRDYMSELGKLSGKKRGVNSKYVRVGTKHILRTKLEKEKAQANQGVML